MVSFLVTSGKSSNFATSKDKRDDNLRVTTKVIITVMKTTRRIKVAKKAAIQIAMNHNCVSREVAENYTDSELREVLRQLRLTAGF